MQQAPDQRVQVEATVDALLRLGQVAARVLAELELVVSAADRRLQIGDAGC